MDQGQRQGGWFDRLRTRLRDSVRSLAWSPEERRRRRRHALVGPPGLWEMKREFQIGFLKRAGLQPGHRLVDIGCGTLRGGIPLIRYLEPGHYCGIEARQEALDEGRREVTEEGLDDRRPQLVCAADLGALSLPERFDYGWAYSVLFHMPDPVLEGCFAFLERHLKPGGTFYANLHIGSREPKRWREFPVVWRTEQAYRELAARHGMGAEDIGSTGELGHVSGRASHDQQRMLRFTRQ